MAKRMKGRRYFFISHKIKMIVQDCGEARIAFFSQKYKEFPDPIAQNSFVSEKVRTFAVLSDSDRDSFPRSLSVTGTCYCLPKGFAGVLKLVDKQDLGSCASRVWVRVPPPALLMNPLGLKTLSDFRGAKVPGTAGRLMTAFYVFQGNGRGFSTTAGVQKNRLSIS